MINKLRYWKRIFSTYILGGKNNLSFWHGDPSVNELANYSDLDQYYMKFHYKAEYKGDYDKNNIPREVKILGLPVTLLINKSGVEVARLIGPAEWTDERILKIINDQLSY